MESSVPQSHDASVVPKPRRAESGVTRLRWERRGGNAAEIIINPQWQGFPSEKPEPSMAVMEGPTCVKKSGRLTWTCLEA